MLTSRSPPDCYPAVSWSLVDADSRKKLAWHAVKRAYAPITINAERFISETRDSGASKHSDVAITRTTGLRIWTSNLTTRPVAGTVHLRIFPVNAGESVWEERIEVVMEPNRSQEVKTILPVPMPVQEWLLEKDASHKKREEVLANSVVALTLYGDDGKKLARFVEWPQPLRHLDLRTGGLDVQVQRTSASESTLMSASSSAMAVEVEARKEEDVAKVRLRAKVPLKAVELFAKDVDLELSDNCIDMVPDEEVEVVVRGLGNGTKILTRHLGEAVGV